MGILPAHLRHRDFTHDIRVNPRNASTRSELYDLQEHQQPKSGNRCDNAARPQCRFGHVVHLSQQALHYVRRHGVDRALDERNQRKADEQKAAPEQELSYLGLPILTFIHPVTAALKVPKVLEEVAVG